MIPSQGLKGGNDHKLGPQAVILSLCAKCRDPFEVTPDTIGYLEGFSQPFDLLCQGKLRRLVCPQCGERNDLDIPLLLYRPGKSPRLIYSPVGQIDLAESQSQAQKLVILLRSMLGKTWQDSWLKEIKRVCQPELRAFLLVERAEEWRLSPKGEQAEVLETAISYYKQSLDIYTLQAFPVQWAETNLNLGNALYKRKSGSRTENLELAIQLYKNSLKVFTAPNHAHQWAVVQYSLGQAYLECTGENRSEKLEESIEHLQQALNIWNRKDQPVEWGMAQNSLGNAFANRLCGDRIENIEIAIRHYRQALGERSRESYPLDWAMTQDNLANALSYRLRGDRSENLEQAISHYQQALEVYSSGILKVEWAMVQHNLAAAFSRRLREDRAENLEKALRAYQHALEACSKEDDPVLWATIHNNLANAYSERIQQDRNDNLRQAIQHYECALEVRTRQDMPEEWATTQNNLANSLAELEGSDRLENVERAIRHYQLALEVRTKQKMPIEWASTMVNLAITFIDPVYLRTREFLSQAVDCLQQALEIYLPHRYPAACRRAAWLLGDLLGSMQDWNRAAEALAIAVQADQVLFEAAFETSKDFELKEAQGLYALAAYAFAFANRQEEAVQIIEKGRARLLREALETRRSDLERLSASEFAEIYARYDRASRRYRELCGLAEESKTVSSRSSGMTYPSLPEDWVIQLEEALGELRKSALAIREQVSVTYPEYRHFMESLDISEIYQTAQTFPLIYLVATGYGSIALVVQNSNVQTIELNVNLPVLRQKVLGMGDAELGYLEAYSSWRSKQDSMEASEAEKQIATLAWLNTIDQITQWLWFTVMEKIIASLQEIEVVFIPGGLFGLLPLHAAWRESPRLPGGKEFALDRVCISYAPSAHALLYAQKGSGRPILSLLAVANPDSSLAFADDEAATIARHFPGKARTLFYEAAELEQVKTCMEEANLLHFATHARAELDDPLEGCLFLALNDRLKLKDVLMFNLHNTRLAVLSACETGIPGTRLLDEVISLPTGFLQAGVPGVIGSSWSVEEVSTTLLMGRFYELWLENNLPPKQAFRLAQQWLRDTPNGKLELYYREYMLQVEPAMEIQEQLDSTGTGLLENPDAYNYAHPFYWGAFGYYGN